MKRFVSRSAFLWIWSKCDEKKIEEKKIRSEKISNEYTLQQKKREKIWSVQMVGACATLPRYTAIRYSICSKRLVNTAVRSTYHQCVRSWCETHRTKGRGKSNVLACQLVYCLYILCFCFQSSRQLVSRLFLYQQFYLGMRISLLAQKLDHIVSIVGIHRQANSELQVPIWWWWRWPQNLYRLNSTFISFISYHWQAYVIHVTTDFVHTFTTSYEMFIRDCTSLFQVLCVEHVCWFNSKIY